MAPAQDLFRGGEGADALRSYTVTCQRRRSRRHCAACARVSLRQARALPEPAMDGVRRLRVVLFGDSLTQRSFAPGGWGARVADASVRRADVINRGYSGCDCARWERSTAQLRWNRPGRSHSGEECTFTLRDALALRCAAITPTCAHTYARASRAPPVLRALGRPLCTVALARESTVTTRAGRRASSKVCSQQLRPPPQQPIS